MAAAAILDFQFMIILATPACWQCGICVLYQTWFKYLLQSLRSTHLYFRPSFDDVTRINFRFRLLVTWSSLHGIGASFHEIWCRYLYPLFWPPKGTSWAERRVLSPHWSRSDARCDLWPFLRNQKKKKKRQWQTGYLPRPPTSPYQSQSLHAGWSPVCSSIFQVLLKSVQWFCRCGWSKIAFPHYLVHWLIQQLVLPYKPW